MPLEISGTKTFVRGRGLACPRFQRGRPAPRFHHSRDDLEIGDRFGFRFPNAAPRDELHGPHATTQALVSSARDEARSTSMRWSMVAFIGCHGLTDV